MYLGSLSGLIDLLLEGHNYTFYLPCAWGWLQVDLLGDKVDYLSDLLEKIYIALDHYSPILKHYPGVSCRLFFPMFCYPLHKCQGEL